jgi:hypothetical protein
VFRHIQADETMTENKDDRAKNNWWLLLYPAIAGVSLFLAVIIGMAFDIGVILYTFVGVPLVSLLFALVLLAAWFARKRKPGRVYLLMFPVYWVVSAILFMNHSEIRLQTRWILHSRALKASVQNEPVPPQGELRHVEFDVWGWAGMDTVEYLIYDPTDTLGATVAAHSKGRFPGIPCEVPMVRRMEDHWFVAMFYTNSEWSVCV